MATVKREYHSQLRERQARATRREIVAAAGRLFVERGYGATTVDAIAEEAGVGRKTVFRSVGGKPECLKLAIDWSLAGDDEPVPIMDRAAVRSSMQAEDARWMLRDYAVQYTQRAIRSAALADVVTTASGLDDAIRALKSSMDEQRLRGMTSLAGHLDLREALRHDLSVADAAQLLCALADTTVFLRLVAEHGWPAARFSEWLGETLVTQLISPDYQPKALPRTERAARLGVDVSPSE